MRVDSIEGTVRGTKQLRMIALMGHLRGYRIYLTMTPTKEVIGKVIRQPKKVALAVIQRLSLI